MLRFIPVIIGCAFSAAALVGADSTAPVLPPPVIVEVDGVKLTLADYERKHPGGLFQAEQAFYDAERKVVSQYVDEYLLDRQAEKEGVTVDQLMERHVKSQVAPDPPEDALKVYYEGVETDLPYDQVRTQILDHLREVRLSKAKNKYIKSLHDAAKINITFGPPRAQITVNQAPVLGAPNADVKVIEYADYECPYCQQAQPAIDKVMAEYKDRVAFVYKDVPLPMHAHAQKAAEAAHCAGAQGKYWEYHDTLFLTRALDPTQLKKHAHSLGLDEAAFTKCLDNGEKAEFVKQQSLEGQGYGLQGTPSFFINGRFISGGLTYEQFRQVLEEELAFAAARKKQTAQR